MQNCSIFSLMNLFSKPILKILFCSSLLLVPLGLFAKNNLALELMDPRAMKRFIDDKKLNTHERHERAAHLHDAMILRRYFQNVMEPACVGQEEEASDAQTSMYRDLMATILACGLAESKKIQFSQKTLNTLKARASKKEGASGGKGRVP